MKCFEIRKNDAGQRLDKFIAKSVPSLPQSLLYKYIRLKRIKVNGRRAQISTRLQQGDQVELYINDAFFVPVPTQYDFLKAPKRLDILYEDDHIMLLDKKAGVLAHPSEGEYVDTLLTRIQRYLYEKGEFVPDQEHTFAPALVNRIDRNTGGIVIAAKTAEALRILNQKMKDRELEKHYLCIVHGILRQKSGTLHGYLVKDEAKKKVTIHTAPCADARTIATKYKVIGETGELSLLEVELLTGRTHQIRAHFASIGHPLLGDGKYGTNRLNQKYGYKKQCLYSYKLTFRFTTDAGVLAYLNNQTFEAENVWFRDAFYAHTL